MSKGYNPQDTTKGPKSKEMLVQLIWSITNSIDQTDDKHAGQRTQAVLLLDRYITEYKQRFGVGKTWSQVWQETFKPKR